MTNVYLQFYGCSLYFRDLFRMSRPIFEELVKELDIPDGRSPNGRSLLGRERILVFLYFASGAPPNKHTCFAYDLGRGTTTESIDICIKVINKVYTSNHMYCGSSGLCLRNYVVLQPGIPLHVHTV